MASTLLFDSCILRLHPTIPGGFTGFPVIFPTLTTRPRAPFTSISLLPAIPICRTLVTCLSPRTRTIFLYEFSAISAVRKRDRQLEGAIQPCLLARPPAKQEGPSSPVQSQQRCTKSRITYLRFWMTCCGSTVARSHTPPRFEDVRESGEWKSDNVVSRDLHSVD